MGPGLTEARRRQVRSLLPIEPQLATVSSAARTAWPAKTKTAPVPSLQGGPVPSPGMAQCRARAPSLTACRFISKSPAGPAHTRACSPTVASRQMGAPSASVMMILAVGEARLHPGRARAP
jgi:hypothetical protein